MTQLQQLPAWVWSTWNLQPLPLLLLCTATAVYLIGTVRLWRRAGVGNGIGVWQAAAFAGGILAAAAALLSPLEVASTVLFSAHMLQHMLLAYLAAPLLALSSAGIAAFWALPRRTRLAAGPWWRRQDRIRSLLSALTHPATIWLAFALTYWLWHAPLFYEAAIRFSWVHYLEHATMLGAACLFWWAVVQPTGRRRLPLGAAVPFLLAASLQGMILSSLLAFSSRPLYQTYVVAAEALGISALADQQLAGMLMRTPGTVVMVVATVLVFLRWMAQLERRDVEFG